MTPQQIEQERRLSLSLSLSVLKRRKKGRDCVQATPSRFVAEMKLGEGGPKEDPREKLRRLREEMAAKARHAPPPGGA